METSLKYVICFRFTVYRRLRSYVKYTLCLLFYQRKRYSINDDWLIRKIDQRPLPIAYPKVLHNINKVFVLKVLNNKYTLQNNLCTSVILNIHI